MCKPFYTGDILSAVDDFINGRVVDVNQAFAPSAAQLAAHIRSKQNTRAKYNSLDNAARQQLLERDKDEDFERFKTPEAVAAVRSLVNNFVSSVDEKKKPKTPEEIARQQALLKKHDEVFAGQFIEQDGLMVSTSLLRTLGKEAE